MVIIFSSVYYLINRLYVKIGCSIAVLKLGDWQLKNSKIIGMKEKIGQNL